MQANDASILKEMQHKRIIEMMQNDRTPQDMYPINELYSVAEFLSLINCSSIEMKIEDNQYRADVNVDEVVLKNERKIIN